MGKHLSRAAARRKAQHRRDMIRLTVAAGGTIAAVAALALTANGAMATSGKAVTGTGTAVEVPVTVSEPQPAAALAVSAPAQAALTFSRTDVRTVAKPKPKKITVAAAVRVRPAEGTLMAPLEALNPSSPFGIRKSPITGHAGEFHWGEDFAASCGTAVYASDAGVVRAAGWGEGGAGNRVEVDHGNGLVTTYNHLEKITVRKGQSVGFGEAIATVGTTGASTGCHLHFETIENGAHTDPAKFKLLPVRANGAR